jgi:hypothetical protein
MRLPAYYVCGSEEVSAVPECRQVLCEAAETQKAV